MGSYSIKKRQSGMLKSRAAEASEVLARGETLGLMSAVKDGYGERLATAITAHSGIQVEITALTRKEPQDNKKLIFDKFGEVIGVDIIPQVDKFIGWSLKKKTV